MEEVQLINFTGLLKKRTKKNGGVGALNLDNINLLSGKKQESATTSGPQQNKDDANTEYDYDFQKKEHVRYHLMLEEIMGVNEIAQVFTLNKNLFVQNENDIKLYGNKNIKDAERLFELVREDLLKKKKNNFIFVRDINTAQRKLLYALLESKGFKRTELFRHYSY